MLSIISRDRPGQTELISEKGSTTKVIAWSKLQQPHNIQITSENDFSPILIA